MAHTLHFKTDIPTNRRLEIVLPKDVPAGEADVVVTVSPKEHEPGSTASDLLSSEIFGMWSDREDIGDSAAFALELRKRAWKRSGE